MSDVQCNCSGPPLSPAKSTLVYILSTTFCGTEYLPGLGQLSWRPDLS